MKRIIAYTVLLFVIFNLFQVITTGIRAYAGGVFIPFLIMVPGTLSMLFPLLFLTDTLYFNTLKLNPLKTFTINIILFSLTLLLLLLGKFLTDKVNTIDLIPNYLLHFIWFPFLPLLLRRITTEPPSHS
ncbi:MAG: hypothetical protein GX640_02090 [Fibrobacter sp.]|nr:hypothetical protein [Fibrobacter sp.]